MNNLLVFFSCLFVLGVSAKDISEIKNLDGQANNSQQKIRGAPSNNLIFLPGEPIIVPDEYFDKLKSEKVELDTLGFVDEPDRTPITLSAIRGMREEFQANINNEQQKYSRVHKIKSFDFSKVISGKVDPNILNPSSEGFVIANNQSVTRVYSGTKIGDIYINELRRAKMGVIGESRAPNFYVNDIAGYKTKVRYENGQMATLLIFPITSGVTFIEIANAFPDKNDELKLKSFISILVSGREGR
ncbi:MAG TPA: hypothetical protein DCE52_13655 [Rhodobacteraceae bacterium]|nr:hypothetical protein [Paracoccaceae bacterium]